MTIQKSKYSLFRRCLALLGASCLAVPTSAQFDPVRTLLEHITPGFTRAELLHAQGIGFQATLDEQLLNYQTLSNEEALVAATWPAVGMTPNDIAQMWGLSHDNGPMDEQLQEARIWRWTHSEQAFYERMTWFWANHFNSDIHKRAVAATLPWFDRLVCRRVPFGSFRPLVHASSGVIAVNTSQTPGYPSVGPMALLLYLDNHGNVCTGPNENYAREALELHVMGNRNLFSGQARQAYTEPEVRDFAKMLTGWTINIAAGPDKFHFRFDGGTGGTHCDTPGSYSFLGQTVTVNPTHPTEAFEALDHAIDYVDTANGWGHVSAAFLSEKLTRAFLTDAPMVNLNGTQILALRRAIADSTAAFGAHGNIRAMLQAILTEQNLRDVLDQPNPMFKYKGPLHYMSSAIRAVVPVIDPVVGTEALRLALEELGQEPFGFGPPIGYPEAITVWAGNQPARWEFAYRLLEPVNTGGNYTYGTIGMAGTNQPVLVDVPRHYIPFGGFNRATSAQQANLIVAGGKLSAADVQIVQDYVNQSTDPDEVVMSRVLFLTMLSPAFNAF